MAEETVKAHFKKVSWFNVERLQKDVSEKSFHQTCVYLLNKINLFNVVHLNLPEFTDIQEFFESLAGILIKLNFPYTQINKFNLSTFTNKMLIIDFFISVIEAFEIIEHGNKERLVPHDNSDDLFNYSDKTDLNCIQKKINFINFDSILISYFSQISDAIVNSHIFENDLKEIKGAIKELDTEFNITRKMMIQRLRLTIKPMNKNKPEFNEKIDIFIHLLETNPKINISDILIFRPDELRFPRVSDNTIKCSIKKYIIGDVPDRGGRLDTVPFKEVESIHDHQSECSTVPTEKDDGINIGKPEGIRKAYEP